MTWRHKSQMARPGERLSLKCWRCWGKGESLGLPLSRKASQGGWRWALEEQKDRGHIRITHSPW